MEVFGARKLCGARRAPFFFFKILMDGGFHSTLRYGRDTCATMNADRTHLVALSSRELLSVYANVFESAKGRGRRRAKRASLDDGAAWSRTIR